MKFLATNVRIFTATNSRGEYHWMSMRLFNDVNPKANPTRLPTHYITLDVIVNEFLKHKDALTENEGGWLDVDMSKIPDEGYTAHHLDNLNFETVLLDGWYQQCYTRDYTGADGVFHAKNSLRIGRNNKPLPPVNALRVTVQYFEDDTFEDGKKVRRWMPVETKETIAQGILERGYIKVETPTTNIAMADAGDEEPDEDDKEAKRAALQAQLDALK